VFYYLALSNTRRVSRLASCPPDGLALWALELLRDAAEAALKFVQVGGALGGCDSVCVCVCGGGGGGGG